jgi:hypothetical protein
MLVKLTPGVNVTNIVQAVFEPVSFYHKKMSESKVRYVARLIYERTSRVIGLNVVYLLMFNRHDTTHVCARKRGREKGRERERVCVRITVRGAYPNPS